MNCPKCDSKNIMKNNSIHNGKPKFKCKDCGRQFIKNSTNKIITQDQWDYVDKLFLEKLPIVGISRVTGISETWLQRYINQKYSEIDKTVNI